MAGEEKNKNEFKFGLPPKDKRTRGSLKEFIGDYIEIFQQKNSSGKLVDVKNDAFGAHMILNPYLKIIHKEIKKDGVIIPHRFLQNKNTPIYFRPGEQIIFEYTSKRDLETFCKYMNDMELEKAISQKTVKKERREYEKYLGRWYELHFSGLSEYHSGKIKDIGPGKITLNPYKRIDFNKKEKKPIWSLVNKDLSLGFSSNQIIFQLTTKREILAICDLQNQEMLKKSKYSLIEKLKLAYKVLTGKID